MILERHCDYVPHQGTLIKLEICPTGVLGLRARRGHTNSTMQNRVAYYRSRAGLSQDDLAEKIGTTRNMLGKLERGARDVTGDWLEKIGDALNVAPHLLIAPEAFLPTEEELAEMIAHAQQTLPAGLPYSEWPQAVAAGLHTRIRTLAGDRANANTGDA